MKTYLIALLMISAVFPGLTAEKPSNIPSKLTEVQVKGWYVEKARNWKSYLLENPEDQSDWLEYFRAARYAGQHENELQAISSEMESRFGKTQTVLYAKAKSIGWSSEGTAIMKEALSLSSSKNLMMADQIMVSELAFDREKRKQLSQELFDSKAIYPSLLNYSYNVLMSVSDNGILVTQGEATTVPLWVLQDVMEIRKDVKILCLDFVDNDQYFFDFLEENNLQKPQSDGLVKGLPESNESAEFFFALTLPAEQLRDIEQRLYVVGLASIHSDESFDHYGTLKTNIEQKFLLDYLTVDFAGEPKYATGKVYESNYILPFLLLKEYYENEGNTELAKEWRDQIIKLADKSQIKNRVEMLLQAQEKQKVLKFEKTDIFLKALDKNMVKLKDNIYASKVEVTNKRMWHYMDYLYKNGFEDLYNLTKPDLSKYGDFAATMLQNYHYSPTNMKAAQTAASRLNAYWDYPAIDVSYEAAVAYCEWLTAQYNQQEDRKFKKVKFRLPSRSEWTMAALGYKGFTSWNLEHNTVKAKPTNKSGKRDIQEYQVAGSDIKYPWWQFDWSRRNKIKNHHECYLANVKTPVEITCPAGIKGDGFTMMSPVATYFPNGLELFDMTGNVAEMIDEKGKAMGGSWNHVPEECTIQSVNEYDGPDSAIGFRLFMEVIEE